MIWQVSLLLGILGGYLAIVVMILSTEALWLHHDERKLWCLLSLALGMIILGVLL